MFFTRRSFFVQAAPSRPTKRIHRSLFFLLFSELLFSQYQPIQFDRITTKDGLSQDIVKVVGQDYLGFMWFGTEDGLNRYDGYSIKVYKHNGRDRSSLSDNDIHAIFEDHSHRLWIGTGSGLNLYNRDSDTFIQFKFRHGDTTGFESNCINTLCEDPHGSLWIGTTKGLYCYRDRSYPFIKYIYNEKDSSSLCDSIVTSMICDHSGELWVGTENGLCTFNEQTGIFRRLLHDPKNRGNIKKLYEDRNGIIWISLLDRGVFLMEPDRKTLHRFPSTDSHSSAHGSFQLNSGVVTSFAETADGKMWIGHFEGYDTYDATTKELVHHLNNVENPDALDGRVETLFRDTVGTLWLGTYLGGVYRFDRNRQKFAVFRHNPISANSPSSNLINAVLEDNTRTLWIGTDHGLDRRDPHTGRWFHYSHQVRDPSSIGSDEVNALAEDHDGNVWIGGDGNSRSTLDRYDRKENRFVHFPIASVRTLYVDHDGDIWIGPLDELKAGLPLIRMNRKGIVTASIPVAGDGVWCIYQDMTGYLWFSGHYGPVSRYDIQKRTIKTYRANPDDSTALTSDYVRSIVQSRDGFLWFGTWGGGMYRYDPSKDAFTSFLEQDGLSSNYVKSMVVDEKGNIWIATEKGITRFHPGTLQWKRFTPADGIQGDRFLTGSSFKTTDGRIYFGGSNGLNLFHPDSIRDNTNIPPVVITSLKVFDSPVRISSSPKGERVVNLAYNNNFFSIEFIALDYTFPQKNLYTYCLEGYDRNWVQSGSRRYASYTGIPPGTYRFTVRGSNNDGVWNLQGASVQIIIEPPYWRRWWFMVLTVVVSAGLLYSVYRYRINRVIEIERLRSRIARDLHDDVGTDLSSIVLASHTISRKLPLSLPDQMEIQQIGDIALRTQEMMRDIVWVLNSRNDTIGDLVLKMRETAGRILGSIEYSLTSPESTNMVLMDLEFKRAVFFLFKEALNNIRKHSLATFVEITMKTPQKEFQLTIVDNGRGFDQSISSAGTGLMSMKMRVEQVGGTFSLESTPGSGTKIIAKLKMT